ncbi:hypothetical protein PF005_g11782 [Phytophthora fragariae]|uniref:RxLR effector protein n=2 Tax=Phytophthora TaxID=4783 RepID=A0A6A3FU53_9STRA|nr:hypothetical protein PF003_g22271 [Phytophthora fragariae]KAE9019732.1 hypothetical protein PR002_g12722 [Phytophthora rubi]KAE8949735.1 hypothetical protein PF009_g711 [Phytophthora fragariae]KAE9018156.1 hypothetical protein PF011_g6388 [Phytophthora fragariae]KAE9040524.1 hypothetical protein PR001_g7023 [Phytophthora rubi]
MTPVLLLLLGHVSSCSVSEPLLCISVYSVIQSSIQRLLCAAHLPCYHLAAS